jgi:hypothetical protein
LQDVAHIEVERDLSGGHLSQGRYAGPVLAIDQRHRPILDLSCAFDGQVDQAESVLHLF